MSKRIHVVAAVIENPQQQIFLAKRPLDKHQGGLWEFPGGKVETGETARQALARELHEEIGIDAISARPLIQIAHDYPDKSVLLDVWLVVEFSGTAHGKENQETRWVHKNELGNFSFPAANEPIVSAAQLPSLYMITPEPGDDEKAYLANIEKSIKKHNIKLLQFRAKTLGTMEYIELAEKLKTICHRYNTKLICNADLATASRIDADGIHLSSRRLKELKERPVTKNKWLATSCHNTEELAHAEKIHADFAVLAPVSTTTTHPDARPLGWPHFEELTRNTAIPIYALGGMKQSDLGTSFQHGAQGIAGISLFMYEPKHSI